MKSLGIDIGTTSITVLLIEDEKLIESKSIKNSFLKSKRIYERIQAPELIFKIVLEQVEYFFRNYEGISSIGITGQMHGIVYVGLNNEILSPLYTWCDLRSSKMINENETYCDYINRITNLNIKIGYGLATHFYNLVTENVPDIPYHIMTIHDYISYKLTNSKERFIHISNAASFGLFDLKRRDFDYQKLELLGLDAAVLPKVSDKNKEVGLYKNVPVYLAIGDNQASFLGASKGRDIILFNVGTGSQISLKVDFYQEIKGIEIRPYLDNSYLLVGSSICGGKAFEALANFFQEISQRTLDEVYQEMVNCQYLENDDLIFETTFSGSREDPSKKGSLHNLTLDNFSKTNFVNAMLKGMTNELYSYYQKMKIKGDLLLVGAGNGIRKNKLLQTIVTKKFKKDLMINQIEEEAAYGAALFSQK